MKNPYEVLGLGRGVDETKIRNRYLELVKQYPPEREPQKAAEIRAAYDELRDPIVRLENQLFHLSATQTFGDLVIEYAPDIRKRRIPTAVLLSLGQS